MTEHYELLYIVPIKFLDDDLQKVVETVNGLIKKFNGTITKEEDLGKQKLSYPINHIHQGTYILTEYDMEGDDNQKLSEQLKLNQEVLRYMIVVKRVKTAKEIAREAQIQEGMRKAKEDELTEIEEKEKEVVVKKEKVTKPVTKKVEVSKIEETVEEVATPEVKVDDKKEDDRSSLEDLDKKLDEILTDDIL